MDGTTTAEFDVAAGKVAGYFVGVPDRPGQTIKFGTTKISPARHAARASRSPTRFLFLPVKP